eukprot:g5484.t1
MAPRVGARLVCLLASALALPRAAVAAGACTGTSDVAQIRARWGTLQESMTGCGTGCTGGAQCMLKCVESLGLSQPCAQCYADVATCTRSHCLFSCGFSPRGSSCAACSLKHCTPKLVICTGLQCDQMPHCSAASSAARLPGGGGVTTSVRTQL